MRKSRRRIRTPKMAKIVTRIARKTRTAGTLREIAKKVARIPRKKIRQKTKRAATKME